MAMSLQQPSPDDACGHCSATPCSCGPLRAHALEWEREQDQPQPKTFEAAKRQAQHLPNKKQKKRKRGKKPIPVVFSPPKFHAYKRCCARECYRFFDGGPEVPAWRRAVEDVGHDRSAVAKIANRIKGTMFLGDGKPCCVEYMMWVFGLHRNDLYYR
jgi:hypothetical protein